MKKILFLLLFACACQLSRAGVMIPREEICYDVKYHWGLIDVMIARGMVTAESDGNSFYGTLNGTSIPWEGHIICVSDTLRADMGAYGRDLGESVRYQSGWYRHPSISTFRSNSYDPADPAIYKNIAGRGDYNASRNSMEAITVTSDMIGMYYFSHAIDFSKMQPGQRIVIPIEGGYSRELTITYTGQGMYSYNGDNYRTYDCTFEYSYDGAMSGYPVECKIGVDNQIPLYLAASLPVGHVEMLYTASY